MAIERVKERYAGSINTVVIGKDPGVTVGGETTMPFLFAEGAMPHSPLIVHEICDCDPRDYPDSLRAAYGSVISDPVAWAGMCVKELGAKALCVRMMSVHSDWYSEPVDKAVATLGAIHKAAGVPLIIVGCGDDERDNELMPRVSQLLKGERALLGIATQANYKTLAATCLADGHAIIAESPIDVNIAKQVNILIVDMGFDPTRIVMHPTTTSLGYGMEYVYSIMERSRLAAFVGDKMLSMPFIVFPGQETWKTKEAQAGSGAQGVNWEVTTAVAMAQSGADIIALRHPDAIRTVNCYIGRLMKDMQAAAAA